MKKILFLLIVLISTQQTQAKIWRVNNNPSLSADVLQAQILFNTTNTVADPEAAAGDTIYFEPSTLNYNGFTVNKANIVVIGYGYYLSDNPGLQAMTNNAKVSNIVFGPTSTGSSISGIESDVDLRADNITVTRCKSTYIVLNGFSAAATLRVNKCHIYQIYETGISTALPNGSINLNVENCIFSGTTSTAGAYGITLGQKIRGLFRNNTCNYGNAIYCYNFYIANNIFIGNWDFGGIGQSSNNVYRNNLFSHNNNPANTNITIQVNNTSPNGGNQFAVDMAPIFNGTPDNTFVLGSTYNNYIANGTFKLETKFQLKVGSVATNAGESGNTVGGAPLGMPACGAYGATDPYRLAGIPAIPTIYALTIPATVTNGAPTMNISISSRSNN